MTGDDKIIFCWLPKRVSRIQHVNQGSWIVDTGKVAWLRKIKRKLDYAEIPYYVEIT